MSRPFIVVGDKTDHGGTVIEGDPTTDIDGKPVACVGHMVVCPKCKGVFPITTGAPHTLSEGRAWARHMDTTACGAHLISGQSRTFWSGGGTMAGAAEGAEALAASADVAAPTASGICLDCLRKAAHQGSTMIVRE